MNTPSSLVRDAEPNPSMTPQALAAQEMILKMQTVCKILGWKADPPSDSIYHTYLSASVSGYPSASVSLIHGQYPHKDRIMITVSTKHDASIYRYGEGSFRITVGGSRTPEGIAKEIERRFLPRYIEIAAKAGAIQKNQDDYRRGMESCLSRLKGAPLNEEEIKGRRFHLDLEGQWGEVQYGGDDTVTLDVHNIPAERAGRILSILHERASAEEVSNA